MKLPSRLENFALAFVLIFSMVFLPNSFAQESTSNSEGPLAVLIRNADRSNGAPPYALADEYGRIQRYVEPSPGIDLASYVGTRVRVKQDTGKTLLSSQLDLPREIKTLDVLQPINRVTSSTERPRVAPSQFVPPRRGRRIEPVVIEPLKRNDRVRRVQFDDADPTTPIDLDDVLPEPAGVNERDFSPTPADDNGGLADPQSIEPIVIEELPLTRPQYDNSYESHSGAASLHGDDCPHCRVKEEASYRTSPIHSCDQCQSKQTHCKNCKQCKSCAGPSCCPASEPGVYGRAEYLLWWFNGMNTPPLVTTGTVASEAVLGREGTQVAFGGDLLDDARSGLRFTLGAWLDDQRNFAIEADWLFMETESVGFSAGDLTGASVIGRPFYNLSPLANDGVTILPPADDAELVSFPGLLAGTVNVNARSEFDTFGIRLRTGLCCREIGGCNSGCNSGCNRGGCNSCGPKYGGNANAISRIDFITGYRYANLDESLTISENLTSLQTASPGTFQITDQFDTDNEFHGVDLGFISEWENRRWAVELMSRIAIGSTRQRVRINGSTTTSNNGATFTSSGGLLALDPNIGEYKRSQFGVLPELSARLGYKITPDLRLSVAYSLMYWANVVRPGDQIDLSVDPQFIPPATAIPTSSSHPQFSFTETGLWAHGLNFGLDYRY